MKKNDLKKLALMGITGGVMMGAPDAGAANQNLDGHMAALSWSQKGHACGGKNGCGGRTDERGRRGPVIADNSGDEGTGHTCGGKTGCGASGRPRGSSNQPQGGQNSCGGSSQPQGGQGSCGAKAAPTNKGPTGYRTMNSNRFFSDSTGDEAPNSCGGSDEGGTKGKGSQPSSDYRTARGSRYTADTTGDGIKSTMTNQQTGKGMMEPAMTEEQFARQLSTEGKKLFNSLSPEGKQLAIRLSKQFTDKNQAVKQAAQHLKGQEGEGPGAMDNSAKRRNLSY